MDYISVQTKERSEPETALDTNPKIPDYNCCIIHDKPVHKHCTDIDLVLFQTKI